MSHVEADAIYDMEGSMVPISEIENLILDTLKQKGYQVVYVGDGNSDIYPSRKADYVCATSKLLLRCRNEKLKCYPFGDFYDVVKIIDSLKLD